MSHITAGLLCLLAVCLPAAGEAAKDGRDETKSTLPGTKRLTMEGDLAARMVGDLRKYLLGRIRLSVAGREKHWHRDFSSRRAYEKSVAPNRARLMRYLGVVDRRLPVDAIEYVASTSTPAEVARGEKYVVYAVRWPVLDGIDAEGLLLEPLTKPVAQVVAIGDADWTPEMAAGLADGVDKRARFAHRLAAAGCRVLVPVLIDRKDTHSGNPRVRMTNQPHREWVYRQAFEMGRHVLGYEVQKILAAVDWFKGPGSKSADTKVGLIGWGEGGALALYAAAVDTRIDAVVVSGYFRQREEIWREPIYRNVFALLAELGDAGVAALIAPRRLIVEASLGPTATTPPARRGRGGAAPGEIISPPLESVRAELRTAAAIYQKLGASASAVLVGDGTGPPGRDAALSALLKGLDVSTPPAPPGGGLTDKRRGFDPAARQKRQLDQLVAYTQRLMRLCEHHRARTMWAKLDTSSPAAYQRSTAKFREAFRKELIGELPAPDVPANPRTRLVYTEKDWIGYEVVLDVWKGVYAYGLLLLPRDLKPSQRRPVVVCQHGLEGRPRDTVGPASNAYSAFARRLVQRGFVVFAPQNIYIGRDEFRVLQRMANPIKCTLFSIMVRQHERITDWLADLPFVDPKRIAFYGLSYGGKSAMRIPPLVPRYCLSICSADFNEWVVKNVTADWPYSYMFTGEYEIFEFDLGHTFNYAEMAALIAPRPFMVERGHHDGVAPDEWVAYEFAKVRRLYAQLGIADRAEIEFFNGPHRINAVGTFRFLHKHLNWPDKTGGK